MQTKSAARCGCLAAAALIYSVGATAADWTLDPLVPGGPFKGIHGLGVGPDGLIYVGSVIGQTLHTVDPQTGKTGVFVPPGIAQGRLRERTGTHRMHTQPSVSN